MPHESAGSLQDALAIFTSGGDSPCLSMAVSSQL